MYYGMVNGMGMGYYPSYTQGLNSGGGGQLLGLAGGGVGGGAASAQALGMAAAAAAAGQASVPKFVIPNFTSTQIQYMVSVFWG